MAAILGEWSDRYQWPYDTVSMLAGLSLGGKAKFHPPLCDLTITPEMQVLDMCCGSGSATQILVRLASKGHEANVYAFELNSIRHQTLSKFVKSLV